MLGSVASADVPDFDLVDIAIAAEVVADSSSQTDLDADGVNGFDSNYTIVSGYSSYLVVASGCQDMGTTLASADLSVDKLAQATGKVPIADI